MIKNVRQYKVGSRVILKGFNPEHIGTIIKTYYIGNFLHYDVMWDISGIIGEGFCYDDIKPKAK